MVDQDRSGFQRVAHTVRRLLRNGRASHSTALNTGPTLPLPALILSDGSRLAPDAALAHTPQLLLLTPYGGNAATILASLTARRSAPYGIAVPTAPEGEVASVVAAALTAVGLKAGAATSLLSRGQIIWLLDASDEPAPAVLEWLADALTAYPAARLLAVANRVPPGGPLADLPRATTAALSTAEVRQAIAAGPAARLALARLGAHAEAWEAAAESEVVRQLLATTSGRGGRLGSIYGAWLQRLVDTSDDDLVTRATDLAWAAQVTGRVDCPRRGLGRLVIETPSGELHFVHAALRHYLAAQSPEARPATLGPRVADPRWREVIALWAEHAPAAPQFLTDLLARADDPDTTVLALRMIEEMGPRAGELEAVVLGRALDGVARGVHPLVAALADYVGLGQTPERGIVVAALANHSAPPVRAAAVGALGGLGTEAGLRELRARLADPDPMVGRAAAHALAAIGRRAIPMLIATLGDPRPAAREMSVVALADMGASDAGASVIGPLREALGSRDGAMRAAAAAALARVGRPAIAVLIDALAQPLTADDARAALVDVGRAAPDDLVAEAGRATGTTRQMIGLVFREVGRAVLPALVRELSEAGSAISDLAAEVVADLAPDHPLVIVGLAHGLADRRVAVRMRCAAALHQLGPAAATEMLRAVAHLPNLQGRMIEIVAGMEGVVVGADMVEALLRVLHDAESNVRLAAVRLLGQARETEAVASLVKALSDSDRLVRIEAARALAQTAARNASAADSTAVEALRATLEREREPEVRAAMVDALGRLAVDVALPIAVGALSDGDDRVRKAALAVFRQAGPLGVDTLVEAVCRGGSPTLRANAIDVLGAVAARGGPGADAAHTVARVWHSLLTRRYAPAEARALVGALSGWRHAREIQRAYETAEALARYEQLPDLADAERHLYWLTVADRSLPAEERWLRPQVQEVLKSLGRIAVQALAYHSAPGRDAAGESNRRVGLLFVDHLLKELRDALDATRLDLAPFILVIEQWRDLTRRAMEEWSGAPALAVTTITESVRLRDDGGPVTLAFMLKNEGTGPARAVRVDLDAAAVGLRLVGEATWFPTVIEADQPYRLEFQVVQAVEGVINLPFQVRFEDGRRMTHTLPHTARVRFFSHHEPYREIFANPYIVGIPVKTPEMFFGREDVLDWIEQNLAGQHGHNVLILFGERRTGKTSLLYQLPRLARFPSSRYVFALVDFQEMAHLIDSTSRFYYGLASRLRRALEDQGIPLAATNGVAIPQTVTDFAEDPAETFGAFIRGVNHALGNRTLVIMLDEFDLLLDRFEHGIIDLSVADQIRALIQHQDRLAFIFAGAHRVRRMIEDPETILFNTALNRRVGFLSELYAEALIRWPVQGVIEYQSLAVKRILEVTHGHPYFIQYICHNIVQRLQVERRNYVDLTDVTEVLREVVQYTTGIIANSYQELTPLHQVVLAALAKVADEGRRFVTVEEIVQRLEQYNINIPRRERERLLTDLVRRDFIEADPPGGNERFAFAMDLVRMWLTVRAESELRDLPETMAQGPA